MECASCFGLWVLWHNKIYSHLFVVLSENITEQDLDTFVDMYREHCEVSHYWWHYCCIILMIHKHNSLYKLECWIGISTTEKDLHTWKIVILRVFEIANQLLTQHSLYWVLWMNGNVFSTVSPELNDQVLISKATGYLTCFLFSLILWDVKFNTQREIPHLCVPLYYSCHYFRDE